MQVIAEYSETGKKEVCPNGHYMRVIDTDNNGFINLIEYDLDGNHIFE